MIQIYDIYIEKQSNVDEVIKNFNEYCFKFYYVFSTNSKVKLYKGVLTYIFRQIDFHADNILQIPNVGDRISDYHRFFEIEKKLLADQDLI